MEQEIERRLDDIYFLVWMILVLSVVNSLGVIALMLSQIFG